MYHAYRVGRNEGERIGTRKERADKQRSFLARFSMLAAIDRHVVVLQEEQVNDPVLETSLLLGTFLSADPMYLLLTNGICCFNTVEQLS